MFSGWYKGRIDLNDAGQVTWIGRGMTGPAVFLWTGSSLLKLSTVAEPHSLDRGPWINSSGWVVWSGVPASPQLSGDTGHEIFLWNGSSVQQISQHHAVGEENISPAINSAGKIVWLNLSAGGSSSAIQQNDLNNPVLASNSLGSVGSPGLGAPQINGAGQVVWQGYDGAHWQIFLWNGSSAQQLTSDANDHRSPQINRTGQVVWAGSDGSQYQIYLWSSGSVRQLTNDSADHLDPQINGVGTITWTHADGGLPAHAPSSVYLWNGSSTQALFQSMISAPASPPYLNDAGQVVWRNGSADNTSQAGLGSWFNGFATVPVFSATPGTTEPRINNSGQTVCQQWAGPTGYMVSLYTPTPPTLTSLSAGVWSAGDMILWWSGTTASTEVWRSTGGAFSKLATLASGTTSWHDTSVTAPNTYTYKVREFSPVDGAGPYASATCSILVAPSGLTATVTSSTSIRLNWTNYSGNNATAIAVWRSTGGGAFTRVAVLVPSATSYSDTGLTTGTTYTYEVRTNNNTGGSPFSNPASAKPQ